VLVTTAVLIAAGFTLFLTVEYNNPKTIGALSPGNKAMAALFESVTTRTAGYSTFAQGGMMPLSKLAAIILMFIGASPAGTGGGIKTTTFAVVILMVISIIRGQDDVTVFKRRMNREITSRAIAVALLGFAFVCILTAALSLAETKTFTIGDLLFEMVSGFGTVGLSTGITSHLSAASRIILIIAMFMGRIGLFTFTIAISNRLAAKKQNRMRYPEDKIMVG